MNKTKLIAATALIGVAFVAYLRRHETVIVRRFPDLDPKVVREAYRIMMKRALNGELGDHDDSEETMDRIFLDIVRELNTSK